MFSPASGRIIIYHNSYLPDLPKCSRIVPFLKLRIKPSGLQTYNRAPQTTNLHALHLFYDIIGDLSHFITYVNIKCNQPLFYNMRDGGCSLQQLIESRCHEEMHQAYVPKSQQLYVYYLTLHPTG